MQRTSAVAIAAAALLGFGLAPTLVRAADISPPMLAPGVKAQAGYETPPGRFVVANPTPVYSDISPYSTPTGPDERVGEPVDILAKVKGCDWYLVGRNGTGIGYISRALLKPAGG